MAWQGFSKRKFPRVDCKFDIFLINENEEKIPAVVKNIGVGGLCVVCDRKLKMFDLVQLDMKLPLKKVKEDVSCSAKVVWIINTVNEFGKKVYDIGFEFLGIKKKDKDNIECIVERCNPYG